MIARRLDGLVGRRFGRWLVQSVKSHGSNGYLHCLCDCGAQRAVRVGRLESAESRSCGCLAAEEFASRNTKHGHRPKGEWKATYKCWQSMRERCLNPKSTSWPRYGGRGITICERWNDFTNFLADMGERPQGTSIDRIDNSRGYEPINCRWATNTEQQNNRSINRIVEFRGERLTLAQWGARTGIAPNTIKERLRHGWSEERALTESVNRRGA